MKRTKYILNLRKIQHEVHFWTLFFGHSFFYIEMCIYFFEAGTIFLPCGVIIIVATVVAHYYYNKHIKTTPILAHG